MFENFRNHISISTDEELSERTIALKRIFDEGVDENLFRTVIKNLGNRRTVNDRVKDLNLTEWVQSIQSPSHAIEVNEGQLQLIFDYLTRFHRNIITRRTLNQYLFSHYGQVEFENDLFLDFVILQAFTISRG